MGHHSTITKTAPIKAYFITLLYRFVSNTLHLSSKHYKYQTVFAIIAPSQTQTLNNNAMTTTITRVFGSVLATALLSGCTALQNSSLYSMWQERAYSAYGMPVPAPVANPFMTAAMPYRPSNGGTLGGETISGSLIGVSRIVSKQSQQEENFIKEYYSLQ
ncbi:hypothetical protein VSS37_01975 [Candidatus Thiothrix sp. Deng01]|uniref:Lipoprotein n=1 Tax=Candidatus Thiothrix phosphatis TaxID=3112415 RepID=A0ABU6CSD2_9GAMM|nr:hypothetical protein [Candidatus Thiothrix sp. Deng01]MEB4589738.1 hypothetical protein [Candidatus Thiothrix sp. Deng01]